MDNPNESVAEQVERVIQLLEFRYHDTLDEQWVRELLARVRVMEADAAAAVKIAPYASHLSNCSLDSWSKNLQACDCGLFALLAGLDARHKEAQS